MVIGRDVNGVTDISLEAIRKLHDEGKVLDYIDIKGDDYSNVICSFYFTDGSVYEASGFSIGYGGTGPHGLHNAVKLWADVGTFEEFGVSRLSASARYCWQQHCGLMK
jgi:hypothetical protein